MALFVGADFEIFSGEENENIQVFAICSGKLLIKEFGRGYGGMAVQSCNIDNQPVTIVYGHLKLESIGSKIGNELLVGSVIGILGQGYTSETDYERKHLHLGIHKGTKVNTLGYVATEAELENRGFKIKPSQITAAKRVGVDYAKEWADKPYRFFILNL